MPTAKKKKTLPPEQWYVKLILWRRGECSSCQSGPFSTRQIAEEFAIELAGNQSYAIGCEISDGQWFLSSRMKASAN